tara:strand:- start:258 stop:467 length:210 start_codon:yes stop_codon:yes gene_type:complete
MAYRITKNNLVAITNQVIVEEMPHNIRMTQWELGRISEAIIEKVTDELAKELVFKFGKQETYEGMVSNV